MRRNPRASWFASADRQRSLRTPLWVVAVAIGGLGSIAWLFVGLDGRSASGVETAVGVTPPPVTWPRRTRRAPTFTLVDQTGAALSLRSLRGQTTILTFLDPACRSLCPLEARVIADALRELPRQTRPAIVAVSVNPLADSRSRFQADARHWRLTADWRWAIGPRTRLAPVWRDYDIEVKTVTKRHAGITIHDVEHGDAAFIIDRRGFQRAMFLYPFTARDLDHEVIAISRSP